MPLASTLDRVAAALGSSLVVATIFVLVLAGSDGAGTPTSAAGSGGKKVDRIVIKDFKFLPPSAEIEVGAKLTFVNEDSAPHTGTSSDGTAFDTGILRKGDAKSVTVTKAGTYAYICSVHPFMKATLKVVG